MGRVVVRLPPLWENGDAQSDQRRLIEAPERISLGATGSKVGKTLGGSIYAVKNAIRRGKGSLGWWVAPWRRTARIGMGRIVSLLPPGKFEANESDLSIELSSGAKIEFRTGENPDALFGDAVDYAIVDEAPRMREAAWTALQTTMLQTMGPIRIFGNTDKGRRNWFYKLFLRGLDPRERDISSHHIRTIEAPHFMAGGRPGPAAIEEARKNLSPIEFEALIMAEFPEDAASVFPGLSRIVLENYYGATFGALPMLLPPMDGCRYVAGFDVANRRDWSVITVLDVATGVIVYWERFHRITWKQQIENCRKVQELYGCPFLVDSTPGSVGDPILERMQEEGIAAEGFPFTNISKNALVDALAIDVQNREVWIPQGLEILLVEMEEFEREVSMSGFIKYHHPSEEDAHDDAVLSLCLANWLRRQAFTIETMTGGARNPDRGGISRAGFVGGR